MGQGAHSHNHTMNPVLIVNELVVGYQQPVIGPLSFTISNGEVVGLAGPNGSGKSTLLQALAGNARIFSGQINHPKELRLAYQQQQPVKLDEMPLTVRDYLTFSRADINTAPDTLRRQLNRRIDRLSGGQYQLLALWAVLGSAAGLVLLDEPTNNLDLAGEALLADLLLQPSGRSVLLVSHEHDFLARSCHRIIEVAP